MDIYKFINSRDIREHLKNINYNFSSLEAAWLIWRSKHTLLSEKHKAWNSIIKTMPDCEIGKRFNTEPHHSLHVFLQELVSLQNKQIEIVKRSETGTVFSYSLFTPGDSDWDEETEDLSFEFSKCLDKAVNECKEYYKYCKDIDLRDYMSSCKIRVKKTWVDSIKRSMVIELNGNGEICEIECYGDMDEQEDNLVYYGFDGMWFAFPTPFKKGDILKGSNYYDEIFVFAELDADSEIRERLMKNGDCSDMVARGYFQDPDNGKIYYECMHDYMCLEYYRGELSGTKRTLKALSSYLKDEIDIDLYSNAYRTIIEEEHIKLLFPLGITDEGLMLAGLKGEKKCY